MASNGDTSSSSGGKIMMIEPGHYDEATAQLDALVSHRTAFLKYFYGIEFVPTSQTKIIVPTLTESRDDFARHGFSLSAETLRKYPELANGCRAFAGTLQNMDVVIATVQDWLDGARTLTSNNIAVAITAFEELDFDNHIIYFQVAIEEDREIEAVGPGKRRRDDGPDSADHPASRPRLF